MSNLLPPAERDVRHIELADESAFQARSLHAPNGLKISALPNGCIYSIECNGILINQLLASPVAGGIQRVYLRVHSDAGIRFVEIVGPRATSEFASFADRFVWSGTWQGLNYRCTCWLHPTGGGWFFHVEIDNRSATPVRCDAVMVQDIGLATRAQVRNNELFTSQYLDHVANNHPDAGYLLMTRQNLPQSTEALKEVHPWLLLGCFPRANGFLSDGFDFFGVEFKDNGVPRALSREMIGDRVLQYEAAYTAIQSSDIQLDPTGVHAWTFFATFVADHPEPSSAVDNDRLKNVQAMQRDMTAALAIPGKLVPTIPQRSVFQTSEFFLAEDLGEIDVEKIFPRERRHVEYQEAKLLSFFHGEDSRHVILKSKEVAVTRPHGHIMRSGLGLTPDGELMSCACYAQGVFTSQLTLGNTSIGKLLSGIRDRLNVVRSSGLRIFVRSVASRPWRLLAIPSAFEMAPDQCRWYYKDGDDLLTVSCVASEEDPAFSIDVRVDGQPVELLICGEIAAGPTEYDSSPRLTIDKGNRRITVRPDSKSLLAEREPEILFHIVTSTAEAIERIGGDELLFADHESRGLPYFVLQTKPTNSFKFTLLGSLRDHAGADALCTKYEQGSAASWRPAETTNTFWSGITAVVRLASPSCEKAAQIQDTLTWFARDAVVHLGTPQGLEQPNGGAWGVRDVCQGPVEFLLSYGHTDAVADILRKLFSQQYLHRFDWPQWFMFPPFHEIQSRDCHGDILIWPLKALCDYLEHTNDPTILQRRVPYTDDETFLPSDRVETILEHVDRMIDRMRQQFLPGLALPRYGEGDWDDSLQPANPLLRERMVSSWTTELMYQTLRRYSSSLARFDQPERSAAVGQIAGDMKADFQRHLMPRGIVTGFAIFGGEQPHPEEYLLHPSDTRTGLHYRLIPMTRGILSGIFTPEQARQHLELIRQHLLFPDGARLMDRPSTYDGGKERTFRRSESAAFFGREIGLQYVHAHLRYAEALAVMGEADDLWRALLVVNPIAVTEVVKNARLRQRNCYFSSSDAAFSNRYEASRDYEKLGRGEVPTDGGWRIYSSGPGIYTSIVIRHLFGLRRHFDCMEFDPVLPRKLDGASCELFQFGRRVRYQFAVKSGACSPKTISVNGVWLTSSMRADHPYRPGPVRVKTADFQAALTLPVNEIQIEL